jgi:alkylation response protein AidB-like acyl-CoA dehydrogenase
MKLPGIDVRPLKQMTGDHEFCEVFFDDVPMPRNALLGELHGGWSVAMAVLEDERSGAGSADVISLSRRLQSMTNNAKDTDSLTRQSLTSLLSRGRSLQSLLEERGSDPMMAPIAKLLNTEIGYDEAQIESRIRGPLSMLESDATDRLLYSPGMRIAGGSSEIQRNIIGERILGLPREPQVNSSTET